jgi:hypothetical protein
MSSGFSQIPRKCKNRRMFDIDVSCFFRVYGEG